MNNIEDGEKLETAKGSMARWSSRLRLSLDGEKFTMAAFCADCIKVILTTVLLLQLKSVCFDTF